uniref:Odorant receptor n=1 Tax=Timema poppense TaxID=170557 RepID=A0A7R9GYT8_TIMPO|nr:unnamed protein product [Timema poppensis]
MTSSLANYATEAGMAKQMFCRTDMHLRQRYVSGCYSLRHRYVSGCYSLRHSYVSGCYSLRHRYVSGCYSLRQRYVSGCYSLRHCYVSGCYSLRHRYVSSGYNLRHSTEAPKWKKGIHSLYSVGVISHTLLYLMMILTKLIIEMDNTEDLVYSLSAFLIGFIVFGKLATLLGKISDIRCLIESLEHNFLQLVEDQNAIKLGIIEKYLHHTKVMTYIYYILFGFTDVLYIGNGLINILQFRDYLQNNGTNSSSAPPPNMILNAYFPFDTTNAINEIIVFVHQTLGMFYCTMICASIDVFYFTLMAALSVQFEILNETLSHLDVEQDGVEHLTNLNTNNATIDHFPISRKSAEDMKQGTTKHNDNLLNTLSTKHCSSWIPNLIDCIQYHQSLLDMSEKMRQLLNPSLYWHYLMISITLCFVGFQAIQLSPASGQFMSTVLFLLCLVSQLGLLCWSADKITVESYKITEVAFGCQWYNASPAFKLCIQNIIRRSQKPVTITAGMFGPLSLKMFMSLLQTSYSYFSVLRQTQ